MIRLSWRRPDGKNTETNFLEPDLIQYEPAVKQRCRLLHSIEETLIVILLKAGLRNDCFRANYLEFVPFSYHNNGMSVFGSLVRTFVDSNQLIN